MKRLLSFCLAVTVFVCCFVGCSNGGSSEISSIVSDANQSVDSSEQTASNAGTRFMMLDTNGNTVITEDHIYEATVGDGTVNGQYYVYIELDRAGTELLKYVTSQSKGQKLPFYLDGELIFEPTVVATVADGEIHILVDTKEQAEAIYKKISSAMLGE